MFHPQDSMINQQSYFLTMFENLFDQLLLTWITAIASKQYGGFYFRNEGEAIEWILILLEMNQI
jgi:hypothetical protein